MPRAANHDLLLRGCRLIDGTGAPARLGDLAVTGTRISAIGDLKRERGKEEINLEGKCLAPGFIDAHAHDDLECIERPAMTAKVSQGVTTVVVGNCGISAVPLKCPDALPEPINLLGEKPVFRHATFASYADAVNEAGTAINVAALIGHNSLRASLVDDLGRKATAVELRRMEDAVDEAMANGAVGFSSGVFYQPGRAADVEELATLAARAGAQGGIYAAHIRDEFDGVVEAMREALDVAKQAGAPLQISHHKCAGQRNWGRSAETLALIDQAQANQDVSLDCYPYTAGSSVLDPQLIEDSMEVLITWSRDHPGAAGRRLSEIAKDWKCSERSAAKALRPAGACYFQMHEDDVRRVMRHEATMFGSDGLPCDPHPHPRLWGAFARVLGHYALRLGLFSLETAVHKMTAMPARRFGLRGRGSLKTGKFADLVVFDEAAIADRSTYDAPKRAAGGIEQVYVNGTLAWDGVQNAAGPGAGRFLRYMASPLQEPR